MSPRFFVAGSSVILAMAAMFWFFAEPDAAQWLWFSVAFASTYAASHAVDYIGHWALLILAVASCTSLLFITSPVFSFVSFSTCCLGLLALAGIVEYPGTRNADLPHARFAQITCVATVSKMEWSPNPVRQIAGALVRFVITAGTIVGTSLALSMPPLWLQPFVERATHVSATAPYFFSWDPAYLTVCLCTTLVMICTIYWLEAAEDLMFGVVGLKPARMMLTPIGKSQSLQEFWGYRWNTAIHTTLKRGVYAPLVRRGMPPTVAGAMTFFASGVLHVGGVVPFISHASELSPIVTFFLFNWFVIVLEGISAAVIRAVAPQFASDPKNGFGVTRSVLLNRVVSHLVGFVIAIPALGSAARSFWLG